MKQYKYWSLCLAIWLGIASISCAPNKTIALSDDEKLIEFTTSRFTLPNLHITPDRKSIIFDVLGDIYQVPIKGGTAKALLQDNYWKRAGKLSPDGKTLAYVSDETGEFQVWTMNLETKKKTVYPILQTGNLSLYAYWNFKGDLLIPHKNGLSSFKIGEDKDFLIKTFGGTNLFEGLHRSMTVNNSGRLVYFNKEDILRVFDLNSGQELKVKNLTNISSNSKFYFNPNGTRFLYYKKSLEIPGTQELRIVNLEMDDEKVLKENKSLGISTSLNYSFDFIDETTIVVDKEGAIVRMNIDTGQYELIPIEVPVKKVIKKPLRRDPQYIRDSIITASVLRNPVTQKDLDTIYLGAFGKLHSYAKGTGVLTEIYPNESRFEVSPSLSPDGKYLAYATWSDTEMGHIYTREISTAKENQLTQTSGRYINPTWSPDGNEIVFVSDETEAKMGIPRQSGGSNPYNYTLDLRRIRVFEKDTLLAKLESDSIFRIYPFSQLPKRFYPVPKYHPNGESIFITTRNHEENLPILVEIDLKTKEVLQERLIPFHTDEIVMAPNAQHVAFVFDEQVWVDNFPHSLKLKTSEFTPSQNDYKGAGVNNILLPKAISVYEVAPSYLYWQDEHTLMWGSAEEIYTYDVRTGKTEKIADIKVQKSRAAPKTQYALTNARIITMNMRDEIIEKGTILVKDNRIETIGNIAEVEIPENYKVFDLDGKTIIPGLIDVHAHYHILFPFEILSQENYGYKGNLAYGVTTIYDPSVNVLDYREQAQMVEIGQIAGPRVFASGNIIMSIPTYYDYKTIQNEADANRLINSFMKLKVHGPIKEYGFKNTNKRKLIKQSAYEKKMPITAHQDYFIDAVSRVINGYSAIEHQIGTFPLQFDILYLIGESKINYTPTSIVTPGVTNIFSENTKKEREKLLKYNGDKLYHNNYAISLEYQNNERQIIVDNWSEVAVRSHSRFINTLKGINGYGGKISIGGHGNPLPGIGTHWELWFINKAITNYEALKAATINGAEKLDLQKEIGSIEKGKLADLVILNSSPLEDIFNTTDISYTIKNGIIYDGYTLDKVDN